MKGYSMVAGRGILYHIGVKKKIKNNIQIKGGPL